MSMLISYHTHLSFHLTQVYFPEAEKTVLYTLYRCIVTVKPKGQILLTECLYLCFFPSFALISYTEPFKYCIAYYRLRFYVKTETAH